VLATAAIPLINRKGHNDSSESHITGSMFALFGDEDDDESDDGDALSGGGAFLGQIPVSNVVNPSTATVTSAPSIVNCAPMDDEDVDIEPLPTRSTPAAPTVFTPLLSPATSTTPATTSLNDQPTREDVIKYSVKQLKEFLSLNGVSSEDCIEKSDLIVKALASFADCE
jgi:hypothetical protein